MKTKVVYIAHPISGAVRSNVSRVEKILEAVIQKRGKYWPIAPYLDACRYLDDWNEDDRERGIEANSAYFFSGIVDELWVCGKQSDGVKAEIRLAIECGIDVVFKSYEELVK